MMECSQTILTSFNWKLFFFCAATSHLANFFRSRNFFQRNSNIMAAAPGKGAGDQPERKKKESILDLGTVVVGVALQVTGRK